MAKWVSLIRSSCRGSTRTKNLAKLQAHETGRFRVEDLGFRAFGFRDLGFRAFVFRV